MNTDDLTDEDLQKICNKVHRRMICDNGAFAVEKWMHYQDYALTASFVMHTFIAVREALEGEF